MGTLTFYDLFLRLLPSKKRTDFFEHVGQSFFARPGRGWLWAEYNYVFRQSLNPAGIQA